MPESSQMQTCSILNWILRKSGNWINWTNVRAPYLSFLAFLVCLFTANAFEKRLVDRLGPNWLSIVAVKMIWGARYINWLYLDPPAGICYRARLSRTTYIKSYHIPDVFLQVTLSRMAILFPVASSQSSLRPVEHRMFLR